MVVRVGRVSDGSRVDCRTVVVSVRVSLGGMPRHDSGQSRDRAPGVRLITNRIGKTIYNEVRVGESARGPVY